MSRIALVLVALVLALAGVVLWWGPGSDSTPAEGGPSEAETVAADAADAEDAEGTAESPAPSADAQVQSDPAASAGSPSEAASGQTTQQQAVAEALRTGEHLSRVDATVTPAPFDPDAFAADPEAYLRISEPGRVYQTHPPGPEVPRLAVASEQPVRVLPGQVTRLQVRAVPGAPVSFLSNQGGRFAESGLNSVTVRADDAGIATVTWEATPGTVGVAPVIAGSPLCMANVEIMVFVDTAERGS